MQSHFSFTYLSDINIYSEDGWRAPVAASIMNAQNTVSLNKNSQPYFMQNVNGKKFYWTEKHWGE